MRKRPHPLLPERAQLRRGQVPSTAPDEMSAARDHPVAIGADGIAGGWIVASCAVAPGVWKRATAARRLPPPSARRVDLKRCDHVAAITELRHRRETVVALDVPLGILEHGGARACDADARRLLGKGASLVFDPPARYIFPALEKLTSKERWQEFNGWSASARRTTRTSPSCRGQPADNWDPRQGR